MIFLKKYNTGIVLSGGAMRGFAHLGVLKALHEAGIFPEIISGTSAGSIVGAFYADGYEPGEILEIFENKKIYDLVGSAIFKNAGLLNMTGLGKLLKENLRAKTFEEFKKPLFVAATNLTTGSVEYFSKGSIVDKVLASSSIPVLFRPIKIHKDVYVDGAITNNLPLEPIKKKCKKLIGVNVHPLEENPQLDSLRSIAIRSFHIGIASVYNKKDLFDMYIEPQELRKYGYFNVKDSQALFNIGYEAAQQVLGVSIGN